MVEDEAVELLATLLRPSRDVRLHFGPNHRSNQLLHIRAIVDESQVVYWTWSPGRQQRCYAVESVWFFIGLHRSGSL